jgi:hypothetical protein
MRTSAFGRPVPIAVRNKQASSLDGACTGTRSQLKSNCVDDASRFGGIEKAAARLSPPARAASRVFGAALDYVPCEAAVDSVQCSLCEQSSLSSPNPPSSLMFSARNIAALGRTGEIHNCPAAKAFKIIVHRAGRAQPASQHRNSAYRAVPCIRRVMSCFGNHPKRFSQGFKFSLSWIKSAPRAPAVRNHTPGGYKVLITKHRQERVFAE